jgi:hypothetical protein
MRSYPYLQAADHLGVTLLLRGSTSSTIPDDRGGKRVSGPCGSGSTHSAAGARDAPRAKGVFFFYSGESMPSNIHRLGLARSEGRDHLRCCHGGGGGGGEGGGEGEGGRGGGGWGGGGGGGGGKGGGGGGGGGEGGGEGEDGGGGEGGRDRVVTIGTRTSRPSPRNGSDLRPRLLWYHRWEPRQRRAFGRSRPHGEWERGAASIFASGESLVEIGGAP